MACYKHSFIPGKARQAVMRSIGVLSDHFAHLHGHRAVLQAFTEYHCVFISLIGQSFMSIHRETSNYYYGNFGGGGNFLSHFPPSTFYLGLVGLLSYCYLNIFTRKYRTPELQKANRTELKEYFSQNGEELSTLHLHESDELIFPSLKTIPAGAVTSLIDTFGVNLFVLWKAMMLRKKILIVADPPLGKLSLITLAAAFLTKNSVRSLIMEYNSIGDINSFCPSLARIGEVAATVPDRESAFLRERQQFPRSDARSRAVPWSPFLCFSQWKSRLMFIFDFSLLD